METDTLAAGRATDQESFRTSTLKSGREPRIELITRNEPRRRWSTEQKQAIAAESLVPGASPSVVARRYGISSGLLYTWRKALLAAQPGLARFARVEVASCAKRAEPSLNNPPLLAGPPSQPPNLIEIALPDGTTVRVDAGIDPRALRRVLAALRG
jgi:transposase